MCSATPGMCDCDGDDVGAWETGSREIEESELFGLKKAFNP